MADETERNNIVPMPSAAPEAIKESDPIWDLFGELDDLPETEARSRAVDLREKSDFANFQLGGILRIISSKGWYTPHASFKELVEKTFGISYRQAISLINTSDSLINVSLPLKEVAHLGWAKLTLIAPSWIELSV